MQDAPPWTTLSSQTLIEDRWIRLRRDRLRTGAGDVLDPWYVLDYPDWAVAVAVTEDRHLLLVRQWRHAAQAWSLELPGGVMDPTDADPVAAAARELLEETGHEAASWRTLYAGHPNPAIQTNRLHVVLATGARAVAPPAPDAGEAMTLRRVPLAEAAQLARTGGIGQAMHVGAILVGLAALGQDAP